MRNGWRGPVYTTEGTADLAAIVLADSAHLMAEDARQANEGGWTRHNPALPLYDTDDAAAAVRLFQTMDFDVPWRIARGVDLEFGRGGHILGSAWAHLGLGDRTAVVSGDLGRQHHRVLRPPQPRPECGAIPDLPVFVDSPMALASLRVYRQAVAEAWPEVRPELLHTHEDPFDPGRLAELHTATQSMTVNNPEQASIIISASGMATGGRVLHHLEQMLPDPRHTVLVVGYAAADADELLAWATGGPEPGSTYLVHGEPEASAALTDRLSTEHGWNAVVPRDGERVLI
ncbi:Cft2 family RNA processing exonuclease [Saccharothrix carnea]|uniref:Cft2 family RNA processing exonuclease n=1 Tax=Saccharothrix carnea TaxID=1280637 RepID=A0A2P8IFV9_SACCR|nr:MBL fold metallo-hydrolase RNA specificity domain-containing protein [Saccharothrix carnea]PSL57351.1 Cft2 family RNA processing exonuclease [Saccharothrix carnea]